MHYAGYPCKMDGLRSIAKEQGLAVIEDAAHAPGARYGCDKFGTLGDVACFSFFSNKNIATGEGGMLVSDRASVLQRARLLRSHAMTTIRPAVRQWSSRLRRGRPGIQLPAD